MGDFEFKKREESTMETASEAAATEEKKEVLQSDVEKEIREDIL